MPVLTAPFIFTVGFLLCKHFRLFSRTIANVHPRAADTPVARSIRLIFSLIGTAKLCWDCELKSGSRFRVTSDSLRRRHFRACNWFLIVCFASRRRNANPPSGLEFVTCCRPRRGVSCCFEQSWYYYRAGPRHIRHSPFCNCTVSPSG